MEGTVKFFNRKKGFGFVSGDDGKDYFVHFTNVAEGTFLRDNDRVSFESAQGERGLKAENVQLLEKGSERTDLPEQETGEEASEEPAPAQEEETPAEEPAEEEPASEETETPAEEPAEEEPASEETETPAEEPAAEEQPEEEKKEE